MLRRQYHITQPKHRVRASSEYFNDIVAFLHRKTQNCPFAAANPVFLHDAHFIRPALQFVQIFQQAVRIFCNFEEPLLQRFFLYYTVATLAFSFYHLFIGQHCLTSRTPVHRSAFFVGQTLFVELQEKPLRPFIIFGQTGRYFPVPVIAQAHGVQLAIHIGNIFFGPLGRRRLVFDSRIFSRQAKGIPTNGMQYIIPMHGLKPCNDITDRIVAHMPHVQVSRRIRKHFQTIVFWFAFVFCHFIYFFFSPFFLPFAFDTGKIIAFIHWHSPPII